MQESTMSSFHPSSLSGLECVDIGTTPVHASAFYQSAVASPEGKKDSKSGPRRREQRKTILSMLSFHLFF